MATYLSEDESLGALAQKGAVQLVKHGLLRVTQKVSEVGDPVWAFLPEDQEWHPAVVEDILPSGRLKLIFIEYLWHASKSYAIFPKPCPYVRA